MKTAIEPATELRPVVDLAEFGCWTVLAARGDEPKALCRCVCGVERPVSKSSLRRSKSTSCGCMGLHIGTDDIRVSEADLAAIRASAGNARLTPVFWAPGYIVSDAGVVYSVRRWKREPTVPFRALRFMTHSHGYPQVNLRIKGRSHVTAVHRLVAEFFLPPQPFPGAVVRHLDGNPGNNAAANLAWGTQADNWADSVRHGTAAIGADAGTAKLTTEDVDRIRTLARSGVAYAIVGATFDVSVTTVRDIVGGITWGHSS